MAVERREIAVLEAIFDEERGFTDLRGETQRDEWRRVDLECQYGTAIWIKTPKVRLCGTEKQGPRAVHEQGDLWPGNRDRGTRDSSDSPCVIM